MRAATFALLAVGASAAGWPFWNNPFEIGPFSWVACKAECLSSLFRNSDSEYLDVSLPCWECRGKNNSGWFGLIGSRVPGHYAWDMLRLKLPIWDGGEPYGGFDYTVAACRPQHTRNPELSANGEGINLDEYPTGWRMVGNSTTNFTGCERIHNWPGLDTLTHMSQPFMVEAMKTFPARQHSGEIWRGNELGIIVNNDLFWSKYGVNPQSLLLGASVAQHIVIRPILDEIFGEVSPQKISQLEASAAAFMEEKGTLRATKDPTCWVHLELLKIIFPGRVASEFPDVDFFTSVQSSLVLYQTISQLLSDHLSALIPGMEGKTLLENVEDIFNAYFPIVNETYGDRLAREDCSPSESCVHQMTGAILDTLFFAGGLSAPGAIFTALWVLYADSSSYTTKLPNGTTVHTFPQNYVYDRSSPATFYWESIRFFPPVLGFPMWTKRPEIASCMDDPLECSQWYGGEREILMLGLGQRDPNAWGMDAAAFRVRSISEYSKSVGFADFAFDDNVASGAMNRNCPAKTLALQLGTTWFKAFDQSAYCVESLSWSYKQVTPFVNEFNLYPIGSGECQ